jgi:CXXC-20-CXXC protein
LLGIQKCGTCYNQFSWKDVVKTTTAGFGYQPLVCSKCGTKHKVTIMTRIVVAFFMPILVFILNLSNIIPFLIPFYLVLLLILIFFIAIMLLFPYFAKYKAIANLLMM